MRVGELFSGIGGFGLAAQRAGCEIAWASEIDDFASRVYGARFPNVPQLGDVTKIKPESVDCITAGFPCQDLSVAGKRKGLVGERSGLFWEIIRVAGGIRPRWLLLENVPGLLSSHRGRDFETVLAALVELGYGVSWRVLDAQFFGVPQRRRRVFIIGHLGGPCPAEVLFESESVQGNLAPGREARAGVTQALTQGFGGGGADDNDAQGGLIVAAPLRAGRAIADTYGDQGNIVTHPLTRRHDSSEDDCGRGTPIVASVVSNGDAHSGFRDAEVIVAYQCHGSNVGPMGTLRKGNGNEGGGVPFAVLETRPRRLTPRECERLQGFPDDWTLIDGASDSARYRALGNAVAIPVVEWIMRRLVEVSSCDTPPS